MIASEITTETGKQQKLIQHHVKYKEIHGVDEIVLLTPSKHRNLHNRLRREGKCKIPVDELTKIVFLAHERTQQRIEGKKAYREKHKDEYLEYLKRYYQENRERIIARDVAQRKRDVGTFTFYETACKNVALVETIEYNKNTGNVSIYSRFMGKHGHRLLEVRA